MEGETIICRDGYSWSQAHCTVLQNSTLVTPYVDEHKNSLRSCNAPDPMRQVSAIYSSLLPCHLLACCILPCHHVHLILHMCSSHASEHFPIVRFAIRHSYVLRRPPFVSCCERALNFIGMARGLPSGLGIPPVDLLSSFVPFGGRLILQRLTGKP